MSLGFDNEQRDYIRMTMECSAKYRIKGDELWLEAFARDLSATGVQLDIDNDLLVGTLLDVMIHPGEAVVVPLQADGEVVWIKKNEQGYCAGLKLSNIR